MSLPAQVAVAAVFVSPALVPACALIPERFVKEARAMTGRVPKDAPKGANPD